MVQWWAALGIDKKEIIVVGTLLNDCMNAKAEAFARPLRDLPQIPYIPKSVDAPYTQTVENSLVKLPLEILYHIAEDVVESIEDLVNFASACYLFWDISRPLIERQFKSRAWAGSRIIYVNKNIHDLPPGGTSFPRSVYNFTDADGPLKASDTVEDCLRAISQDANLPSTVRDAIACMLPTDYKRTGEPAVLRNLSKKLFIRSEAIQKLNKELAPDPKESDLCLGDALMVRIRWSSKPSNSWSNLMGSSADRSRGPWAGDRFGVILAEEFEMQCDYAEWGNASESICDELGECWKGWHRTFYVFAGPPDEPGSA